MPLSVLDSTTFASTDAGCVYRCPCCGDPTLRFGDREVTLTRPELRAMARTATKLAERPVGEGGRGARGLRARTARQDVTFVLDRSKALELAELLHAAAAMVELDGMLRARLGLGLREGERPSILHVTRRRES